MKKLIGGMLAGLTVAAAGASIASSKLLNPRECYSGAVSYCINRPDMFGNLSYPEPTPYWRGKPGTRSDGLPVIVGPGGELFHNMSSIALAGFTRSTKPFPERCAEFEMGPAAKAALDYLKANSKEIESGALVWHYDYATQLNDVVLDGGWASAFSQSAIIQLFLLASCKTNNPAYADLARKAAAAFDVSVIKGGLKSESSDLVWFQEVPLPDRHNPFIFNAHLYAVETLLLLHRVTRDDRYRVLADQGIASAEQALPVIDTGNWNRYDLRPPPQFVVCQQVRSRVRCKLETGLFPQEFDPRALTLRASRSFPPDARGASPRPISGEMQDFRSGDLSRVHWGHTAKEYLPWHADLIRSIGVQTARPQLIEAGERWMRYYAAYQRGTAL